jgi:hypothetical protein
MRFRESRTIKAIGELRGSYPYAAALLSYVVVERVVKRYALDHWTDPALAKAHIPPKVKSHGRKPLSQLRHLTRSQRLHEVLSEMTLGDVEALLRRPEAERSASDRNEVMHSNLYLKAESTLPKFEQQALNRTRFAKAFSHLKRALDQFAGLAIVERKGALVARSLTSA